MALHESEDTMWLFVTEMHEARITKLWISNEEISNAGINNICIDFYQVFGSLLST